MPSDNKEPKRGIPRGFIAMLFLIVLSAYAMSRLGVPSHSSVAFSYQLEHLVNLDLLVPEESRKIGTSDQLVTFSGRLSSERSAASEQKYRFLELLQQHHSIALEQSELLSRLSSAREEMLTAADYYLQLCQIPIPQGGFDILLADGDGPDALGALTLMSSQRRRLIGAERFAEQLQEFCLRAEHSPAESEAMVKLAREFIFQFQARQLGLVGEARALVKRCHSQLAGAANHPQMLPAKLTEIHAALRGLLDDLGRWRGGERLVDTKSSRDNRQLQLDWVALRKRESSVEIQLDKARQAVRDAPWYFNDRELSTRKLEQQDPEIYSQWFASARQIWDRFDRMKNASFRVPDQPRNPVLDRTFKSEEPSTNYTGLFLTALPTLTLLGLLYLAYSKQIRGIGSNALSFGKSPAKLMQKGSHKVTFRDVAGIEEAKDELQEIVEFLKEPQRFSSLGAQIPKGILCIGPPGTGKTLVAKAVAGEANRPFFSISGSDFVEMFVGVGASRIRDMFEQARKSAPCIIFMDEIDAVGRHRGAGMGGGHDEREQTLNQLLVEMDGFDANEGIILMAATNRPDVLDKALLRPGRFDRQVVIDLPDIKGRFEILKLHARKVKLGEHVDLMLIARATAGCSGADLKNILNEAALLAVKRDRQLVGKPELAEACDKVRFGKERKSLEITEQEKRSTAFHEAGHAIVGLSLQHCDPIEKVTVIPRGMSLGATYMLPTKNRLGYWRQELRDLLAMLMGGRCAEERFVGDISSGAKNDIERATELARSMVCEWGMSERLGLVAFDDREDSRGYVPGMGGSHRQHSPQTSQAIDEEVSALCQSAHERATQILVEREAVVKAMTDALFELETLDASDLKKILDGTFDLETKRRELLAATEIKPEADQPVAKSKTQSNLKDLDVGEKLSAENSP